MEHDRNTPGPEGPTTRRVVAWALIAALALAGPVSLLVGFGGGRLFAVAALVLLLVGGVAFWLHRRTGR